MIHEPKKEYYDILVYAKTRVTPLLFGLYATAVELRCSKFIFLRYDTCCFSFSKRDGSLCRYVGVHALRDIAEGEELLWDYGVSYDRSHYADRNIL